MKTHGQSKYFYVKAISGPQIVQVNPTTFVQANEVQKTDKLLYFSSVSR